MFKGAASKLVVSVVVVSLSAACSTEPDGTLPTRSLYGNCADPPPPPLCEWMEASDAVVFGTVQSLEIINSPVVYSDLEGQVHTDGVPQECHGGLNHGLAIDLMVSQARGDFDSPGLMTIKVGYGTTGSWSPAPYEEAGQLEWTGPDANAIVLGQGLGAGVMRVDDFWSPAGEVLFATQNGLVEFQYGGCNGTPESGVTLDTMFNEDCSNANPALRRERRLAAAQSPSRTHAAGCGGYGENVPNHEICNHNIDCPAGELCSDGACVPDADQ